MNHLADEASPYLQMHHNNPVDWYPWNETSLEKAKQQNKPILLSIGYTACHWCHVMAHESFEDEETARLMNQYFINIKVDKEERPDLDKIYQLSAQLLTRQPGGWPLTVFLMPDNHIPFFAGTYFPKNKLRDYPSFKEVLQYVHYLYHERRADLTKQNLSFRGILDELKAQTQTTAPINSAPIKQCTDLLVQQYDDINGGFGTGPKFPMVPALWRFYLSHDLLNTHPLLNQTLVKMINGGIYDHIGGGFFRYTVDGQWLIPHFEKMLYDNALLISLLAETNPIGYSKTIVAVCDWVIREMSSATGGYYATLSADTEGQEGKFYVWSNDEVKGVLTEPEYRVTELYFNLIEPVNFEHFWHLHVTHSAEEIGEKLQIGTDQIKALIESALSKLLVYRDTRIKPQRDEKIIVAWNGLMIKAMAIAGRLLHRPDYIESAQHALDFIKTHFYLHQKLPSTIKDKHVKTSSNLDDYVFLIEGIFYLLQANWRGDDFTFMKTLVSQVSELFEDHETGGFFYTAKNQEQLIYRLKQYSDDSIPASNAVYTHLLRPLGFLLNNSTLIESSEQSLANAFQHIQAHPDSYCSFITALQYQSKEVQIIFVRGVKHEISKWQQTFDSYRSINCYAFFIASDIELPEPLDTKLSHQDETIAYFCKNFICKEPITTLQDFEHELRRYQN